MKERQDDFNLRREHLKNMSDQELKAYFLELAEKIVDPMLDMAYKHTSKSIERSVLLRMGFSSVEAKGIVELLSEHNLLSKGAGHCVYVIGQNQNMDLHDAGMHIANGDGIKELMEHFKVYEK